MLGESAAPEIALIGTSNSDPKGGYNFGGFLQQYLGADILNQAITGGSFEGALLHYLPSEEFQKHPPKILVREMPYQNLPSEDRKMDKVVRQAVPLVNNGCAGRAPLLSAKDLALQPGTNEVLFNGGGRILPILSKDHVLDIQFSDPGIKDLHGIVWYMNGRKESLKIHFTQYVDNGGRFVAELRHDQAIYADSTFMAFNLMLDQPPPKPLKVNVQLCARVDTPAGPKSTIASR
jgi:alginate biosynthesis protein AlgX